MDNPKHTVIKVMGLGGGGSNAVNRMIELSIEGIDFIAANTDAQALRQSLADTQIQLGPRLTRGLGAGGNHEVGEAAARESLPLLKKALSGADMIFLTAGMGGGTGTGAISVAAEAARSTGALTIAVVSTPFTFEGTRRLRSAQAGLSKLRPNVDTLITVPNDKLLTLLGEKTAFDVSLRVADEVLRQGVQGIAELVSRPGLINVDFANIRSLMQLAGGAMMAIGQGRGENKALEAIRQALRMPLLDVHSVEAACGVLVHFTGGEDLGLFEVSQAADEIGRAAPNAEVVLGASIDPLMKGRAQVILIATGLGARPLNVLAPAADIVMRRPARAPQTETYAEPAPASNGLAEQLFGRVGAPEFHEETWAVAQSPGPDLNHVDMPAFLRRRRSLREFEGRQ